MHKRVVAVVLAAVAIVATPVVRADEPGSGRVSSACLQHQPAKTGVSALMSSDALCARTS